MSTPRDMAKVKAKEAALAERQGLFGAAYKLWKIARIRWERVGDRANEHWAMARAAHCRTLAIGLEDDE